MDPFYTAQSSDPTRPRLGDNGNNGEVSKSRSFTGLRRSAGLLNLKLGSPTPQHSPLDESPTTPTPANFDDTPLSIPHKPILKSRPSNQQLSQQLKQQSRLSGQLKQQQQFDHSRDAPLGYTPLGMGALTPDQSMQTPSARANKRNISLKRPHPFSSSKPNKSGFLSRSTATVNTPSAAPSKRLHADVSFQGARPLQTAFAPHGLLSKRNAVQSPAPRVPDTPCKRMLPDPSAGSVNRHFDENIDEFPRNSSFRNNSSYSRNDSSELDARFAGRARQNSLDENATLDRLQRFSIHDMDDAPPPETPTRFGVHTSTPLARNNSRINRGSVQQRSLSGVLQSVDPADSLSLCPPDNIESALLLNSSSLSDASMGSPQTPDQLDERSMARMEAGTAASSPRPKHLRMFDLDKSGSGSSMSNDDQMPLVPPVINTQMEDDMPILRVSTPTTPATTSFSAASLPFAPSQSVSSNLMSRDDSSYSSGSMLFDEFLAQKFERVQTLQLGEFSAVFVVVQGKQRFAVKRTKRPLMSLRERLRFKEEVSILQSLGEVAQAERDDLEASGTDAGDDSGVTVHTGSSHIVQLMDTFEHDSFGYIMTEYCENGDLSRFLAAQGRVSRLEEWRVWKILVEVLKGLTVVHEQGMLHLDLKPANVFVTFEGHLKIGDFGMATRYPVPPHFEREGDREYIAPEVLERQEYSTAADIFSLGIMMVEVAANIVLPDNGVHWQRLRSGDLSDAGRLSSGDLNSSLAHASSLSGHKVRAPPSWAPRFLVDGTYVLDQLVSDMLNPHPEKRPSASDLLKRPEIELVNNRGQAGAVVYEGEFGPEPDDEGEVWQRA